MNVFMNVGIQVFFFIFRFIGSTLVNTVIQVSGAQFYIRYLMDIGHIMSGNAESCGNSIFNLFLKIDF